MNPPSTTESINLQTPLSLSTSFGFPLQSAQSRREVLIGGLLLLVPFIGWLLNMGHRIQMVHQMMHGQPAWPAWKNYRQLLKHGCVTFAGMLYYYTPAIVCGAIAWQTGSTVSGVLALVAFVLATIAIPGYMSHYCREFNVAEMFNPALSARRVLDCGRPYWHAWLIALTALALSFLGLLALGIGFFFTSVWFWQVAGFSFATTLSHKYALGTSSRP